MSTPTQSTPGGCFIGALAILPGGVALMGFYGLVKWALLPADKRHFDDQFWLLVKAASLGSLATLTLLYLSYRLLRVANFQGYDSRDPDEPTLKW